MLMHIRGGAELNEGLAYDGIPYVQGVVSRTDHFLTFFLLSQP